MTKNSRTCVRISKIAILVLVASVAQAQEMQVPAVVGERALPAGALG